MFSQGIYYKFGKKVFNIAIAKRLPLVVLGVLVIVPLSIFLRKNLGNISIHAIFLLVLYVIILAIRSWYEYASHQFMLDEFSIHIRKGIFNRQETAIPYRQIQDVSLKESYTQRMFGVVELSVFTAGHDNPESKMDESSGAFFPLIDHSYATELQQELLKRSNVQEIVNREPKIASQI
jgi:uncharacterized membrane protein YdbT with pleckstrin-like domain